MSDVEKLCPTCDTSYTGPECPICAPLERVQIEARNRRREYAMEREAQRAINELERTSREPF